MKDRVSVIMPAYNSEDYIGEAITSVLEQSYSNLEILVTDDASTDHTAEVVRGLSRQDNRVHLFRNRRNRGAAASRNRSLEQALGRYLAFLDADDIWLPGKLEAQIPFMSARDAAFSFTGYAIYDGNGQFRDQIIGASGPDCVDYAALLRKECTIGCSTVILDRAKLGHMRMIDIRTGQDYALWLHLLRTRNISAHNLKQCFSGYRILPNSVSRNKIDMVKRQWRIYRHIEHLDPVFSSYLMFHYAKNALFRK